MSVAEILSPRYAGLLAIAPGDAGLNIARTSYLASSSTAELAQSLYRDSAYTFVAELRPAKE